MELYEKYAGQICRFLYSITGEWDTAEELTQETFARAWKNRDSFREEASVSSWLCGIAKNLWKEELRKRKREVPLSDDIPAPEPTDNEEKIRLYRAMQELDAETREVMLLRLTGDLSFRDIGEIMGHTEVWARTRFYRGKEKLITRLRGGVR